jgi:hypothetical protein
MKKIKYLIFGALVIVLILLILLSHFYISFFYGGFNGFLAEFRNLPVETKLSQLRDDAIANLEQSHSEISSLNGLTFYEKTHSDMCAVGEHGWKRSDHFANLCSYRIAHYYGISGDYSKFLLNLENAINGMGWKIQNINPPQLTISEAISEYSDDIFSADFPVYVKEENNKIMYLRVNNFPGYYYGWSELKEEPAPFGFGIATFQIVHKNQSPTSPNEIFHLHSL